MRRAALRASAVALLAMARQDEGQVGFALDHEARVHEARVMKNITFSADEQLIEFAREEARARRTTLNSLFREWLDELARRDEMRAKADEAIRNLSAHLSFDRKLTREELNER